MTKLHIPDEAIQALRDFDLVPDASRVDAIARPVLIAYLRKIIDDRHRKGGFVELETIRRYVAELEAET